MGAGIHLDASLVKKGLDNGVFPAMQAGGVSGTGSNLWDLGTWNLTRCLMRGGTGEFPPRDGRAG